MSVKLFFENLKTLWSTLWGKLLFLVFVLGFIVYGLRDIPLVGEYQMYFYFGTLVSGYTLLKKLSASKSTRKKPSRTEKMGPKTPPNKSVGRAGVAYLETLPVKERDAERAKLLGMNPEKRAEYIRSQREDLAEELFGPPMRAAQPKIERMKGEKLQRKNAETSLWVMPIVISLATIAVAMALLYYTVTITIWVLPLAIAIGGGTFILMAIKTWGKETIVPKLRAGIIILGILGVIWLYTRVSSGKFEGFEFKIPEVQGQVVTDNQMITPTPLPQSIEVETSPGFSPEELTKINIGLSEEAEDQLRVVHETNAKATQLIEETFQKLQTQFESDPYNQYHPNYEVLLEGEGNAIGSLQVLEILQKWFNTHHMQNTEQGLVWVEGNPFSEKVKTLETDGFITTAQAGEWLDRGEKEALLAKIRVQLLQELQQNTWTKAAVALGEFNRNATLLGHSPLPTNMVEVLQEASGGKVRPMPTPIPYQAYQAPVKAELEKAATGTQEPATLPETTPIPTPTPRCNVQGPPGCECPEKVTGRYLGALDGRGQFMDLLPDLTALIVYVNTPEGATVIGNLPNCNGIGVQIDQNTWALVKNRNPDVPDGTKLTSYIPPNGDGDWILYGDGVQVWPSSTTSASNANAGVCAPDAGFTGDITGNWNMAWALDITLQIPLVYKNCPQGGAKIERTSDGVWYYSNNAPPGIREGQRFVLSGVVDTKAIPVD
jgi:hypothetical protein